MYLKLESKCLQLIKPKPEEHNAVVTVIIQLYCVITIIVMVSASVTFNYSACFCKLFRKEK